jgi:HPt (histidine-containing phosphotransfer) domain-containing protein
VQVLRQQAGVAMAGPRAITGSTVWPPEVAAAALAAGVDLDRAVARLGDKPAVYLRLLGRFIADLADWPAQLQAEINGPDAQAPARRLHTLRGVAATLGLTELAAAAAQAEGSLPDVQAATVACDALLARIGGLAELDRLRLALQTMADPTTDSRALDSHDLRAALEQLAELLDNSDMAAMDAMADLQQRYAGPLGSRLTLLDDAVAALSFEPALQICRDLIETLDA